jgi:hypothetical protein
MTSLLFWILSKKMLQAKELWKQSDERKAHRMRAMRPVLANLFGTLKVHARTNPDSPYFAFDVPSFVFGYPLYDHNEAVEYIYETLVENGFQVWKTPPAVLFISWMKPAAKVVGPRPPKPGPDYRPFVYDDSAFSYLASKRG